MGPNLCIETRGELVTIWEQSNRMFSAHVESVDGVMYHAPTEFASRIAAVNWVMDTHERRMRLAYMLPPFDKLMKGSKS